MTRLAEALRYQGEACRQLGSPFMGQLMDLLADRLRPGTELIDRLFDWPGDLGPRAESVPLRLAGALHRLRLEGHAGLDTVYPPNTVDDDTLWAAISDAFATHSDQINTILDSAPQTNEVRRSAVLIAGAQEIAHRHPLPLRWFELGASAGLNLTWDQYRLEAGGQIFGPDAPAMTLRPEWSGDLPPPGPVRVTERAGVDLRPMAATTDRLRLLSYLWPDQPERLALTDAAIGVADTPVEQGDAIDWLKPRLTPVPGHVTVIAHTVAWQYFPQDKQDEGRALIEAAGRSATDDAPLAWLSMENDGAMGGASVELRLWPGDIHLSLGRADFHGRWIEWSPRPILEA